MSKLTQSPVWQALEEHYKVTAQVQMRDLFAQDADRFNTFSLRWNDFLLDFSKNRITQDTLALLLNLAEQADVAGWAQKMFRGEKINITEDRAVLHIALRNRANRPILVDGKDVMPDVNANLAHMREFSEAVRNGAWTGYTGKAITDVVNIGIGGSDLGPVMVTEALKPYGKPGLNVHFVIQHRRYASGGNAETLRSRNHAVPCGLENVHHAGDHHERHLGQRMAAAKCAERGQ